MITLFTILGIIYLYTFKVMYKYKFDIADAPLAISFYFWNANLYLTIGIVFLIIKYLP